ncbi:MAG: hypothetical protein Q9166_004705 [cf. Caloplaca sp. 2 TL-2023]
MSETQREAWQFIKSSRQLVVMIHGPPGTGKTTFITKLFQIFEILGISYQGCTASNVALDWLSTKSNEANPDKGIIRGHSMNTETRAIKSWKPETLQTEHQEPTTEDIKAAGEQRRFLQLLYNLVNGQVNKE